MPIRIVEDGSVGQVDQAPRVILPDPATLYAERAARFEVLAEGHAMAGFLRLMAQLARAQAAAAVARLPAAADTPPADALRASREFGMPPLSIQGHVRGATWRADLRAIVTGMLKSVAPEGEAGAATHAALAALQQALRHDADALETVADRLLAGESSADDAAIVPFVGAALQVYFARRAATLSPDDVAACDVATLCPVCGARPVASLIRLGAAQQGLRYLHCAVCESEWHMVRIKCSSCESTKGINYLRALRDGQSPQDAERASRAAVVSAETCDECRSYLKLVNREKAQFADPVADDLATLALDMLVDERDYLRAGPNLLFHPGAG